MRLMHKRRRSFKQEPLISVVTVFSPKRTRELSRLIQSIRKSIYKKYEVIVVDNSQNSHLSSTITSKFPGIRLIVMPHNTGVLGFNIGFANAKGEYVLALDDDCTIRPDTLKNIAKVFPKKPKRIGVLSTNIYEPPTKRYIYQNYLQNKIVNLYTAANMAVFRREIFAKVGYYDPDFFLWVHEDDLSLRILNKGYKICFDPRIVVNHYLKKNRPFRKSMAYFLSRNLVWFNIKHFSLRFWPLLIIRNLGTILLMPLKRRSLFALIYAVTGYVMGWLTFFVPLKKRKVVKPSLQKKFLKFYLFNILGP